MNRIVGVGALTLVWMAVSGSFSFANLLLGVLLGAAALFIVREEMPRAVARVRLWPALVLGVVFVREVILSAWKVAKLVLSRRMDLKPGIFAYPLTVERDFQIAMLANLVTLTPGTLSVDVSQDRRLLFVHAIDSSDPETTCAEIRTVFEERIERAFP
jgi:multicomponent Na+:H+ antiporter subunit E